MNHFLSSPPFAIFGLPGQMELLIIAGVALLLFGHRLPGVMRSLGSGITEFKKGMAEGVREEETPAVTEKKP